MRTEIKKKILLILAFSLVVVAWFGCDFKTFSPTKIKFKNNLAVPVKALDLKGDLYQDHIQTLFDNRCVACHSCYNSPCQVKLSSYEGAQRGGSKIKVYDGTRLKEIKPTRLFQDAHSEKEWRKKGFYSVLDNLTSTTSSAMEQVVSLKSSVDIGKEYYEYYPEAEDLNCSENQIELSAYLESNPHLGMPFGFPALTTSEEELLGHWFKNGSPGPTVQRLKSMNLPSNGDKGILVLSKWNEFLNQSSLKAQIMSRYIFEHLFIGHMQFKEIPGDSYYLVRSKTQFPKPIDEISTPLPYDDPGTSKVFYRFRKVISTLVHKTHIIYELSDKKMARFDELFLSTKWKRPFLFPSYDSEIAANPFRAFEMIPAKVRYQFLLDNSHFFITTFIRGPVCKGQLALNSIRDHFSVVFLDPSKDLFVTDRKFEKKSIDYLATPIQGGSSFIKSFYFKYHLLEQKYVKLRERVYEKSYKDGTDHSSIWKGNKTGEPILTIYRHLDSATVLAGQKGGIPKTLWVIDYPLFERIYYTLVAGFNVFGSISHQLFVRTYMDDMRIEGENNFLTYIPLDKRFDLHSMWHKKDELFSEFYFFWERKLSAALGTSYGGNVVTKIKYKSNQYVEEFLDQLYSKNFSPLVLAEQDPINNHSLQRTNLIDAEFFDCSKESCVDASFSKISNRYGEFIQTFPEERLDLMFIRIRMKDGKHLTYSLVKNKARLNVDTLFNEDGTRNPNQDTFNVFKGFVGSYPNLYFDIAVGDIKDFFNTLINIKLGDNSFYELVDKYGVRRLDKNFWEISDWFNDEYYRLEPSKAGLFDLNRYANIPKDKDQKVKKSLISL